MQNKFTVSKIQHDTPLGAFVAKAMRISGNQAKRLLDNRNVFVNGRRVWMAKHKLKRNDVVEVNAAGIQSKRAKSIKIIYEDPHCLVADKPAGMLSNGEKSCETILQKQTGNPRLRAVHRLDKDTSGCLLFAKNEKSRSKLIDLFKNHAITKQYIALIHGKPERKEGSIQRKIEEATAKTMYRVVAGNQTASCIHIRIVTGKTHQIRRHFHEIGHPILGDKKYGSPRICDEAMRDIPRQMLHASKLSFTSPHCETKVRASAPEPTDMKQVHHRLIK